MYVRERNKVLYFLFLCAGFSKQMVEILNKHNIQFSSFDIFSDEEVRQGLKTYSNWPTYPQLYVSGELIGGLDIIKVRIEKTVVERFHAYCCLVAKLYLTLGAPWTAAHQAPLPMGLPRQEYWGGPLVLPSGGLTDSGFELVCLAVPGGFFTTEPPAWYFHI